MTDTKNSTATKRTPETSRQMYLARAEGLIVWLEAVVAQEVETAKWAGEPVDERKRRRDRQATERAASVRWLIEREQERGE